MLYRPLAKLQRARRSLTIQTLRRGYHDDASFGFRIPKIYSLPDCASCFRYLARSHAELPLDTAPELENRFVGLLATSGVDKLIMV